MINIPQNKTKKQDYDKVVKDVLKQLETGEDQYGEGCKGHAYIDWGVVNDIYKNCPSQSIAYDVAMAFKEKGYYVYVQCIKAGSKRFPSGTPICYRIQEKARKSSAWPEL